MRETDPREIAERRHRRHAAATWALLLCACVLFWLAVIAALGALL